MAEIKTLNGYELVDAKARADIEELQTKEVDLTGYATETWVQEQKYLTEHQSLDNYYTKEETEEAIYNSKDAYYIDFTNATNEGQDATEEMIAFLDAMTANRNVCAHIKDSSSTRYRPAAVTFSGSLDGTRSVNLMQSDIVLEDVYAGEATEYSRYIISYGFTGKYTYWKELNTLSVLLATHEYVDEAIAAIPETDITGKADKQHTHTMSDLTDYQEPDLTGYATETYVTEAIDAIEIPDPDLSQYYTKTETNLLLDGIDTGVSITDDGEGNVTIEEVESGGTPSVDLDDYATNDSVDAKIDEAIAGIVETRDRTTDYINLNVTTGVPVLSYVYTTAITSINQLATSLVNGFSVQFKTGSSITVYANDSVTWTGDDCEDGVFNALESTNYDVYSYYNSVIGKTVNMVMNLGDANE